MADKSQERVHEGDRYATHDDASAYKCPNCGAPVRWDSQSQTLVCAHCDNSYSLEAVQAAAEMPTGNKVHRSKWRSPEAKAAGAGVAGAAGAGAAAGAAEATGTISYTCGSCGAVVEVEATTASTTCPYCGNHVVLKQTAGGQLEPDYVIPFKVELTDAQKLLRSFAKGKRFIPKHFLDTADLQKIKGQYVPYWLYDCRVDADAAFDCTSVRTWSDRDFTYTETETWLVRRSGKMAFQRIPVDGSVAMDDATMEALEPYDYRGMVPFDPAYLSGYQADRYDVGVDDANARADQRVHQSAVDTLSDRAVGYGSVTLRGADVHIDDGTVSYAMLPVWTVSATFKGKEYQYAMNGQTGKIVGELPVSKGRMVGFIALWGVVIALAGSVLLNIPALL